jgi:Lactonase, 7-bladed beta-propeller
MKFRKFGKAILMSAVSVGLVLGVTSCVQSYTVGFLFVTGTSTAGSGQGIISGFKIDHNTGNLKPVNGTPVGSGGANPGRAILAVGSRFVYVLNRGTDPATNGPCTAATINCNGANISEFAVGGSGVLAFQAQFFSQGMNPFRIVVDSQNNYIYVLDAVAPSGAGCAAALGPTVTTCGDITAFKIDQSTGRLSLQLNAQVTSATGSQLPYFPVPADPIDMVLSASFLYTLSGTPATGDVVYPYAYNSSSGQLTVTQNSAQPINAAEGTAIATAAGNIYVLDNEPITIPPGDSRNFPPGTYLSQILPFTPGTGGALQAQTGGAVPDDPNQSSPIMLIAESKGKWVYVANQGPNTMGTVAQSGIVGYVVDPSSHELTPMANSPFSMGSGPQCLLEDPSNQFFYTANFNDSTVTGRALDANSGSLNGLKGKTGAQSFKLNGPAAWCFVSGRTS